MATFSEYYLPVWELMKDHIKPKRNQEGIVTIGLMDFLLKPDLLNW